MTVGSKNYPIVNCLAAFAASVLLSQSLPAAVTTIYDGEQATLADDLAAFDAAMDLGPGDATAGFYGVENVPMPTAFGTGDAMRMFDFSTVDKPELQGEFASPLLEPFRIDVQSVDQSTVDSSSAIRFRMSNSGESISSENRSAFSVSWQSDGKITAKHSDPSDGVGDVDTVSSDADLTGVQSVSIVGNGHLTDTYSYSLFGESRTISALSYDIFINGALLNSDFPSGLAFHPDKSGSTYDTSLGLQRFGFIGSSNSNVNPDVLFDNIVLRTGDDIAVPEPSALGLLMLGLLSVRFSRKRC